MAGTFGFARETSELFARACRRAADASIGLGAALGDVVIEHGGPGSTRACWWPLVATGSR
jgi:predicted MFS family arabinose efflux permease